MRKPHCLLLSLVAALLMSCAGCGRVVTTGSQAANPLLSLQPSTPSLQTGQPTQLQAILTTEDGSTEDVTTTASWKTSAPGLVVLKGAATCSQAGTYTVTAGTVSLIASTTVTCVSIAALKPVSSIQFVNPPSQLTSKSPSLLSVQATYADGTTSDVTSKVLWKTDGVAHVTGQGIAYCNTGGISTISATLNSSTSSIQLPCFLKQIAPKAGFAEHAVRFDGPFASWLDLRSFGAVGDGVADDTNAVRMAIAAAKLQNKTLSIPHGTYAISDTIHIIGVSGMSIIGEDPRSTSFKWIGAKHGTMISFEGSAYFRMTRIALDGNSHQAGVGVYMGFDPNNKQHLYSTYDALEDASISQVDVGLSLGWAGETTINRVHFDHDTTAINLHDWNALNFNVIDSLFTDNTVGVTNEPGCGNFNVSNSVFARSTYADMMMGNTGSFSIRQNLSVDSQAFFVAVGSGAPAAVTLEGNVIRGSKSVPIQYNNPGVIMLVDNAFEAPVDSQQAILVSGAWAPTDVFSLGNLFTTSHPYQGALGTVESIDEVPQAEVLASSLQVPASVYVPTNSGRPIVEVPATADAGIVQTLINDAANRSGGAVVHFGAGSYRVNATIDVPDAPGLALVGDGLSSSLVDGGIAGGGAVLRTHGSVQIEGLYIGASAAGIGLQVLVADQPSTRIMCDLCTTLNGGLGNPKMAAFVSGLDNAKLNMRATTLNGQSGFNVSGGINQAAGRTTFGATNAFMTVSDTYTVNNMGRFLISDGFHDGGQQPLQAQLNGNGVVTHEGGSINATGYQLNGFGGTVSFLGVMIETPISADKASAGSMGLVGSVHLNPSQIDIASPNATVKQASSYDFVGAGFVPTPAPAASAGDIERFFAQGRTEHVVPREVMTVAATVVQIHRVMVGNGSVAMLFSSNSDVKSVSTYVIKSLSQTGSNGTCSAGTVSLHGAWSLDPGTDGFYGLKLGDSYLGNVVPVGGGAGSLSLLPQMTDAGQRWLVQALGDGTFSVINRADGSALTMGPSGCAAVNTVDNGASQQWLITAATI